MYNSLIKNRHGNHTVTRLTAHLVLITKYRYHVLKGEIHKRCRELLIQVCDSEDVRILKGVVSKDHMHIEYPPSRSISDFVKGLKGRSSRLLQKEFPELGKRYLGNWLWRLACRKHYRRFDTRVFGASQGSS